MIGMAQSVSSLAGLVELAVRAAVGSLRVTALIDFPNYPNVGDSAIYLGQLACLESLGIPRPRFICDFRSYDRRALRDAVGDGAILLTGGGSFGDLWPIGQECREDILRGFPDNPVIQLPQTMHFQERSTLNRARAVVDAHRKLTLLWRDERSLETARREFNVPSQLCPDMAFCLGRLARPHSATQPIVWLARTDKERAFAPPADAHAIVTDWVDEPETRLRRLSHRLRDATTAHPTSRMWRALLMRTYAPLARQRLRRGLDILSSGKVVITDRLHGHILALLLGIPHVVIDNTYGKLSSFYTTWIHEVDGVRFAESADEALDIARALAGVADTVRIGAADV